MFPSFLDPIRSSIRGFIARKRVAQIPASPEQTVSQPRSKRQRTRVPSQESSSRHPQPMPSTSEQSLTSTPTDPQSESWNNADSDDPLSDIPPEREPMDTRSKQDRLLYTASGEWEWANGHEITNTRRLRKLSEGSMCTAEIMEGFIGKKKITYIARRWPHATKDDWTGFYSEVLQGHAIPNIIGVYSNPTSFTVAMQMPHNVYWMEASSMMPDSLKELCIDALLRIHSCGVLHNDIELRHMLISPDGRVTIIDFQESRALFPMTSVGLGRAQPEELAMEMRKLKFKLDYQGAREKERARMERLQREAKERASGRLPKANTSRASDGLNEDDSVPMPSLEEWNLRWLSGLDEEPKKIVVPFRSKEEMRDAEREFVAFVNRLEASRVASRKNPISEAITPTLPQSNETTATEATSSQSSTVLGKRRATDADITSPLGESSKRIRGEVDISVSEDLKAHSPVPSYKPPLEPITDPRLPPLPPVPPQFPLPFAHSDGYLTGTSRTPPLRWRIPPSSDLPQSYPALTSFSHSECDSSDLPCATPSEVPPKAIKVVDCVDIEPKGPRGYYFPHPPTEIQMGRCRVVDVRQQNYLKCRELDFPYYGGNSFRLHTHFPGSIPRGYAVSLGRMKRDRNHEYSYHRIGRSSKQTRCASPIDSPDCDPSKLYATSTEALDLSGDGPRYLSYEDTISRTPVPRKRRAPPGSNLCPTPNIKKVSYASWDWVTKDGTILPSGRNRNRTRKRKLAKDEDDEPEVIDFTAQEEEEDARIMALKASSDPSSAPAHHREDASFSLGIIERDSPRTAVASTSLSAVPPSIANNGSPRASPTPTLWHRKRVSSSLPSSGDYASQESGPSFHLGSSARGSRSRSRVMPQREAYIDIEMTDAEEERIVEIMLRCPEAEEVVPEEVVQSGKGTFHALSEYVIARWSE